jgi:hypothetical protein
MESVFACTRYTSLPFYLHGQDFSRTHSGATPLLEGSWVWEDLPLFLRGVLFLPYALGLAQPRLLAAADVDTRSTGSGLGSVAIGSTRICTGGLRTLLIVSFEPGGLPFRLGAGNAGVSCDSGGSVVYSPVAGMSLTTGGSAANS